MTDLSTVLNALLEQVFNSINLLLAQITNFIGNFLKWPGASPGLVGLLGQGRAGGAPLKPWGSRG